MTHIVFSRILYKCSPNAHILFDVKKVIEKLYQEQHGLALLFFFKDSIKFSPKGHAFFSLANVFLRNLNHGQYSLTYITIQKTLINFLSKAHVAN